MEESMNTNWLEEQRILYKNPDEDELDGDGGSDGKPPNPPAGGQN